MFTTTSRDQPIAIHLSHGPPGFTETLQLLQKGEKAVLWMPQARAIAEPVVNEIEVVDVVSLPSDRIVVLRKTIVEERGQLCLGQSYRYFFRATNDRAMTLEQMVREANLAATKRSPRAAQGGVRALRAPFRGTMAIRIARCS